MKKKIASSLPDKSARKERIKKKPAHRPRKPKESSSIDFHDKRFRALADNLRDVIMLFDRNCRHLYVNPYVEKQTGIPAEKFFGKTHRELSFPEYLCDQWEEAIQYVFTAGKVHRIEFELPNHIWIDWLLMPELNSQGKVDVVITAARDITERKRLEEDLERRVTERTRELQKSMSALKAEIAERKKTEQALRESEEKYRSLFQDSKDMVYFTTPEGRFLDINPAGVTLLGYRSREDVLCTNVAQSYFNVKDRTNFQEIIRRDGYVKDYEVTLKRVEGNPLQVLITAIAVRDKTGNFIAYRGIIRDITERRKLEQQLFHVQKMESIGTLAGGIAHDFNNILGGIMGYASLMKTKITQDHPFFTYVETIEKGAQRAAELTSKLLAFAMGGTFHTIPLNVNEIIQETIKMVSRFFDRSVEVRTLLDDGLPTVEADPALMQQVVMNLLVNARDAMPKGGILVVETRIDDIDDESLRRNIEARKGRHVVISVTDTGMGIETDTMHRIFEPFFSTKEKGKGTGLGLAVVYGVVKNHGGFVKVYSHPGKGSTFRVYLPVSGKPIEVTRHPEEGRNLSGNECILIVDDEKDIRDLTQDAFKEYGYRVLLAVNGEMGCELYKSHVHDIALVLLDMVMPQLGGMETLLRLKTLNPQVKVILSSGYSENGRPQEIISYGVSGFIQKPYKITQLLSMVRSILDKKAANK